MIAVLDSSAAVEFILNRTGKESIESFLLTADSVIAPDIFISEISNVFWKYHKFESLRLDICEELIEKSIQLIDRFESSNELYRESFHLSCENNLTVYDSLYMVLARRNHASLLSIDKKLNEAAKSNGIKILNLK